MIGWCPFKVKKSIVSHSISSVHLSNFTLFIGSLSVILSKQQKPQNSLVKPGWLWQWRQQQKRKKHDTKLWNMRFALPSLSILQLKQSRAEPNIHTRRNANSKLLNKPQLSLRRRTRFGGNQRWWKCGISTRSEVIKHFVFVILDDF